MAISSASPWRLLVILPVANWDEWLTLFTGPGWLPVPRSLLNVSSRKELWTPYCQMSTDSWMFEMKHMVFWRLRNGVSDAGGAGRAAKEVCCGPLCRSFPLLWCSVCLLKPGCLLSLFSLLFYFLSRSISLFFCCIGCLGHVLGAKSEAGHKLGALKRLVMSIGTSDCNHWEHWSSLFCWSGRHQWTSEVL